MKKYLVLILLLGSYLTRAQAVTFYGSPNSIISSGAVIPEGKKMLWTSGSTGGVADSTAQEGTRARYGDTKTQALNILSNFQKTLLEKGLTMKDVLMLRVYLAPDKATGTHDYKGWNEAYSQYFGTAANPTKPIRSTIGIAGLANTDKFIEIELVAVYP
jgi:enamine deaminase RidA (YjgF/YER057c/UK114 family)